MSGFSRVRTKGAPHPILFTKGSVWRFHTRREIWQTGHHFSVGETIEVVTPIDNVGKTLACGGDIHRFARRSDETKYSNNKLVRGTVELDKVIRFVERVSPGTPVVYYLMKVNAAAEGYGHYFCGKSRDYPNVQRFEDACFWENRVIALKALYRGNWFHRKSNMYPFYKLMSYDERTDSHSEIHIPESVRRAVAWTNEHIAEREHRSAVERFLSDAVLKKFDDFKGMTVVRMPDFDRAKTLKEACIKLSVRKPVAIADRYAVVRSLDEAVLIKMALPGYEVIEVAT